VIADRRIGVWKNLFTVAQLRGDGEVERWFPSQPSPSDLLDTTPSLSRVFVQPYLPICRVSTKWEAEQQVTVSESCARHRCRRCLVSIGLMRR
jgi:hypothetical protein